jgi:beta-fructofuranosidase
MYSQGKGPAKTCSVEIFVNDGDAVFTSRVFPTEGEHFCSVTGDSFTKMWSMKRAVKEQFLV